VSAYWSWFLAAWSLLVMWQVGSKRRGAWLLGVLGEVWWLVYALATHQPGFVVMAFVFAVVYARNWLRWGKG
jgi:hypothetical protein